jgi:hypothetical protein
MIYRWKTHGIPGVAAQAVGQEINCLIEKHNGHIQPKAIVNAARPKSSPLHKCFDWNDRTAAEKYRQEQAKYLLRAIVVVEKPENSEPLLVRAFVSVPDDDKLVYTTINRAAQNPQQWDHVLDCAIQEIQAWRQKYKDLQLFARIHDEIDALKIS